MSLLKSISEGLKSLTTTPEKTASGSVKQPANVLVNYDAGGELMHKHEEQWKSLYQETEDTAKKAEDLDVEIGKLYVTCDRKSELLGKLHEEAASMPILLTQLQEITNSLANVEELYDHVEAALVHLENVCEEQEFVRSQLSHHKQLAVYKMKKDHELQRYRASLARDHAAKVDQMNKKKQSLLREKQSAYEDQFTQDLDYYKKHGKIERLPDTPESQRKLDLADVDLEEDEEALDAFLESSAVEGSEQGTKSDTETEVLSDGDGSKVEITGEITSPSEPEVTSVASPEQTGTGTEEQGAAETGDQSQPEDLNQSQSASTDQDSNTQTSETQQNSESNTSDHNE